MRMSNVTEWSFFHREVVLRKDRICDPRYCVYTHEITANDLLPLKADFNICESEGEWGNARNELQVEQELRAKILGPILPLF